MADMASSFLVEIVAGLVGIFVGTLAALAVDRHKERRRNRQRARIILRTLEQELKENHRTLQMVRPVYLKQPFGKSFYLSTTAWETAMASDDLPAIIGFALSDELAAQYGLFVRIRYHVNLLTQLWFAPTDIDGYTAIQRGLNRAIVEAMQQAIGGHIPLLGEIEEALRDRK